MKTKIACVLLLLVLGLFTNDSIKAQEAKECNRWQAWTTNGSDWQAQEWQKDQCAIYQVKL